MSIIFSFHYCPLNIIILLVFVLRDVMTMTQIDKKLYHFPYFAI